MRFLVFEASHLRQDLTGLNCMGEKNLCFKNLNKLFLLDLSKVRFRTPVM